MLHVSLIKLKGKDDYLVTRLKSVLLGYGSSSQAFLGASFFKSIITMDVNRTFDYSISYSGVNIHPSSHSEGQPNGLCMSGCVLVHACVSLGGVLPL